MPQWLFIYIFKFKKDKLHGAKCDITAIFRGGMYHTKAINNLRKG